MRKILHALLLVSAMPALAYCQADTAVISKVINNLKSYSAGHIKEKAYLQFDKPYYAAGDTLYFKAYVTAGDEHKLSSLSGILHVDLIDPSNKITRFILLQLINGIAWGDFALPDSLAAGNYRIRAYSRYMQPGDYFDKQLVVGSNRRNIPGNSVFATKNNSSADVQFFPEGGNLVTDIRCRVAFKATGTNGLGADVNGAVTDNYNNTAATFRSGFAGMGSFTLLPEQGRSYSVRYKLKDSILHVINLPPAVSKGITLSVSTADENNINISIIANPAYLKENHGKDITATVYAGGKLTYVHSKLDSYELDLQLPVAKFQSGVARVTLFNSSGDPLAERLIFIKNPADNIAPAIKTDKSAYNQREKVSVDLTNRNTGPNLTAHYSAAVISESKLPGATYPDNIYTYLLLTSELKGYIENPAHYFDNNTSQARADLNVLMLTQGYRKFSWKQLANGIPPDEKRVPERAITISGYVRTLNDKNPVINGTVNLLSPGGGPLLTTKTDSTGYFKFAGLIANDTTKLVLSATNVKGKDNTLIRLDKSAEEAPVSMLNIPQTPVPDIEKYLQNRQLQQQADFKYDTNTKLLKQVNVNAYRSSNYGGAGHADQVLDLSKDAVGGTLVDVLNGRLNGVNFFNGGAYLTTFHTAPMLIVIDGVQYESQRDSTGNIMFSALNTLNARDIATVEVLKYANTTIYGLNGGNGVLVITTKQGENTKFDSGPATGMLSFRPNGFYLAREFYSPKYLPGFASTKPDLRSTIFWQPEIKTDEAGKASFNYYNADGTGTYRIIVEGIDVNGNIAHAVYKYEVK